MADLKPSKLLEKGVEFLNELTARTVPSEEGRARVLRIGVITEPLGTQDTPALRFLIIYLNTLQHSFEFELSPTPRNDPLLVMLALKDVIQREDATGQMEGFVQRAQAHISNNNASFSAQEPPPDKFVILSTARFNDNWYAARMPDKDPVCAILALGNWKRNMAPPTLAEFFIVLLLRQAVALASPSLCRSVHLGTKGCLFDFTEHLSDVRYKILSGLVCDYCTEALKRDGLPTLKKDLLKVLSKDWIASADAPNSVASITAKLGHSLFV